MIKLLKFTFVYLFFFLIGDVVVSNFFIKTKIENNCYEQLDDFYRLKKNCYAKEKWIKKSKSYKVYTDKNGHRYNGDKNARLTKDKTAVFFGGSFTYGMGASFEDSFVGLIEKNQKDFNIINLGVAGYSPTVFNYQLKELIQKKIIPDKIFLVLDIVDINTEATNWEINNDSIRPLNIEKISNIEKGEKKFKNFKKKNFKITRIISTSINNSLRSLRFYISKLNQEYKKPELSQYGSFLSKDLKELDETFWQPFGFDEAILKIKNGIQDIGDMARNINADFYIIIYPWPDSLEYGQEKFNWEKFADQLCNDNSCTKLINFFPEFNNLKLSSKNWVNKLYLEDDVHLTIFGHDLIAQKILIDSF